MGLLSIYPAFMPKIKDISVGELKEIFKLDEEVDIIDVRNRTEYDIVRIRGARLIPVNELMDRLHELDHERKTVFYCRTGRRSRIAALLAAEAVGEALNLCGGVFDGYRQGLEEIEILDPEKIIYYLN